MAHGHEMDIKQLAGNGVDDDEMAVTCTCGWFATITEEKFATPLYSRHLRMNLVPPHHKPEEWE